MFLKIKIFATVIFLLLLVSCDAEKESVRNTWENAPERYICSQKELGLVKREFSICNKSSFLSSYCYASGLMKYCRLKSDNKKVEE